MQTKTDNKALLIAAVLFVVAFWPKIGPIVKSYIDRVTNIVVVSKNPFDDSKPRVLIVYPTEAPLSSELTAIINSTDIRQIIADKGGEFKAFDNQAKFVGNKELEYKKVIDANVNTPMPYIAIGKDSSGTVEPVPAKYDDAKALIERYMK